MKCSAIWVLCGLTFSLVIQADDSAFQRALKTVASVEKEGEGNQAVASAWKVLVQSDPDHLIDILAAIETERPISANWFRAAAQGVRDRSETPRLEDLGGFVLDTFHAPKARALAFAWIEEADPQLARSMLPGFLNDPSNELRRRAVAVQSDLGLSYLAAGKKEPAAVLLKQTLQFARDIDQIESISKHLKELGKEVDLPRTFGFLTQWKVIGPFDNTGNQGFERVYPPEITQDFSMSYEGKKGEVTWQDLQSDHPYGMVDFNKPFGSLKEVVGYAATDFYSELEQDVELRLGCKNGWKIWVNGDYLFGRDEYHRGMQMDQYILKTRMKPGNNRILVKLTQNEQVEDWTVEWEFQLRVCDQAGTPIFSAH